MNNKPKVGEIWTDGLDSWLIIKILPDGYIQAKDVESEYVTCQLPEYFLERI